jgi:TfoX/Sxy family transcriptional regulator of competence genes
MSIDRDCFNGRMPSRTRRTVRAADAVIENSGACDMKKPSPKASPESVALYDAALATIPAIKRKGAAMPYTSVNGNMFSVLPPDGLLALRLPSPDREDFLKRYKTSLCVMYGAVMKEYVQVPAALMKKTPDLAKWLAVSYRYACSLKAKPTTKKKPTKNSKPGPRSK